MLQETMNKYDSPFSKLEQIVIMNYLKGLELGTNRRTNRTSTATN